ncbi:MAG: helix-turn-helix domain-containing protein [Deltaproteobacteria bacterium]|nr:helix-turn-helix domain-containing protein [Deltaproteobacteria bacterium]
MAELRACRRFGIARSTFNLWRDRYRESGDEGLARRPGPSAGRYRLRGVAG